MAPPTPNTADNSLHLGVVQGQAQPPSWTFTPGREHPTVSVGQAGDWRVSGPGVAPVHAYVYFDGTTLYVQSALAGQPILVAGQPVANQWQPLPLGAPLDIGGVRLLLRAAAPPAQAPQAPPWQAPPAPAVPPAPPAPPAFDDMEQTRAAPPRAAGGAPHWQPPGYGDDDERTRMAPAAGRPAQAPAPIQAPAFDDDDERTLLVSPEAAHSLGTAPPAPAQPLQNASSRPARPPPVALDLPPASEMTRVAPLTEDARAAVLGMAAPLPAAGAPAPPMPMQMPPVSPMPMTPPPGANLPGANYQPPPPPVLAPTELVRSVKESPLDKFRAMPPVRKVLIVLGPFGIAAATWLLLADSEPAPAPKKPVVETPAPTPSASQTASTPTQPPALPPTALPDAPPPDASGQPIASNETPDPPEDAETDGEPKGDPRKPKGGRRGKEPVPLSLERQAVDAYVNGDLETARALYGRLQAEHPENPTFAEIVTILDSKRPTATPR